MKAQELNLQLDGIYTSCLQLPTETLEITSPSLYYLVTEWQEYNIRDPISLTKESKAIIRYKRLDIKKVIENIIERVLMYANKEEAWCRDSEKQGLLVRSQSYLVVMDREKNDVRMVLGIRKANCTKVVGVSQYVIQGQRIDCEFGDCAHECRKGQDGVFADDIITGESAEAEYLAHKGRQIYGSVGPRLIHCGFPHKVGIWMTSFHEMMAHSERVTGDLTNNTAKSLVQWKALPETENSDMTTTWGGAYEWDRNMAAAIEVGIVPSIQDGDGPYTLY